MKPLGIYFYVCSLFFCVGNAQENPAARKIGKIDSLRIEVNRGANDTNKVNNCFRLLREFIKTGTFDSCTKYAESALALSIKLDFARGKSGSYNNLGVINHYLANYPMALEYYEKARKIREALHDKKAVASSYSNMSKIYYNQGNYPLALECIFKALAIIEKTDDKNTQASLLNDAGNLYLTKPAKALEYYQKSLKIYEEINGKQGIANGNNNIGVIYSGLKDYDHALIYFAKALKLKEEIGDKKGQANTYDNIGGIYVEQKKYAEALEYHFKSLNINREMGEKYTMGPPLNYIATVYSRMGNYKQALPYALQSLEMAKEVKSFEHIRESENTLRDIYDKTGNPIEAYKHYMGFIAARDSIYNEDNTKQTVRAEMNFEFEKQKAIEQAEQEKKDIVVKEELQRKELEKNFFIAGFVLVLLFTFILYRNYRQKKKANELLALQKAEIELQKALVDEKNHEVTDSIRYAQRIQSALLTSEQYVKKHIPDFFIFNKPRDIVSGDFYWFLKSGSRVYAATADCTGHGVPGAFMSMLGINFLNEIIIERKIKEPGAILDALRAEIIGALNPEGTLELAKDGMDIVLCCYDMETLSLTYGAANNSFYLVRNGIIFEQKFDKMPVGVYNDVQKNFTTYTLPLQKGDLIYTFTDGYADQFGGLKGKKFKYKQLEKLLSDSSHLSMTEQKNVLEHTQDDWRGNLQQVDDILIIGLRV